MEGNALQVLRSVERSSKAIGCFSIWPTNLRYSSSSSIEMFCKPCYTQGGIAILKQMNEEWAGKVGKEVETNWKAFGKVFPHIFHQIFVDLNH